MKGVELIVLLDSSKLLEESLLKNKLSSSFKHLGTKLMNEI